MNRFEKIKRKHNIKKIVKLIIAIIILICISTIAILYIVREDVRKWIDLNILKKEIGVENSISIDLDITKNNQSFAYSKYIAILSNKSIVVYDNNGNNINTIETDINQAVYDSCDKYLALAEENGKNFSIIFDKNYLWSGTEDCEISQIHINENGYVAVISSDETYKSIVSVYDSLGKMLFKTYFASTRIIDLSISSNNKYLAIGEIDISGSVVQSNIKVLSVEKAKNQEDAVIYTYNANKDKLITNVNYQSNDKIVCMYSDSIGIIKENESSEIFKVENSSMFLSNELNNSIVYVEEKSDGIFSKESNVHIINTENLQENVYKLNEPIKNFYAKNNVIVANVGTELHFFNNRGWLIKKYNSNKEISNIIFSDDIAGIIYKNKIEIINL